jgi:elongation factor Tu
MTKEEGGRDRPILNDQQVMSYSATWDISSYCGFEGKEMVMPGEDVHMTLKLLKPMAVEKGQTFTLRDGASTIGTGKVRWMGLFNTSAASNTL